MAAPTVLFDLDGTMLSTAPDLMASLNHVLALNALEPVVYQDMTWLVGQGARVMIERAFELRGQGISGDELSDMMARFIEHYEAAMPGETRPFPGFLDALDRLAAAGMRLGVCTNKLERLSVRLLDRLGLSSRFHAIAGGDTFPERKPHGSHVTGTILAAGGDPENAVMIGDSINDILAARNAGVPAIAVPFGYTDQPVETLEPDWILPHFDALDVDLVERLIAAARRKDSLAAAGLRG